MLRRAITLVGLAAALGCGAPVAIAAQAGGGDAISRVQGRPARDLIPVRRVHAVRVVVRTEYVRGALNHNGPPVLVHGARAAQLAAFVNRITPVGPGDDPLCDSSPKAQHARVGARVTVRFLDAQGRRLARARLHERNCVAFIRLRVDGFRGPELDGGTPGESLATALRHLGVRGIPPLLPN
jgi:hypothetical protein